MARLISGSGTLSGATHTTGSTSASDLDSGTLATARMASGTTLQTKGDTLIRVSSYTVTTSTTRVLSTALEVPITCSSTSNYLRISCFIPDVSNAGNDPNSLKAGFRYSTDSYSSSDVVLGDSEWLDVYGGYLTDATYFEHALTLETWEQVPVAGSEIKIQLSTQAITGNVVLATNAGCTFSLIVSEIKA